MHDGWADDKVVLVTGAARGIGEMTARRLHAGGARLALVGLEPDRLSALADELGEERAAWFEADVTDVQALQAAVDGVVGRFGRIDVAVANAGVHYIGAFEKTPLEVLERELEINLLGVLRTDHVVLPHLLSSRGYLLNVASLAAASHAPLMTSYAASKAGVEGLSNSLRGELASRGVGVGCAYFGFIDTDMVRDAFAHSSTTAMLPLLPSFVRRPVPVDRAVDAIERGIRGRRARVWAPRYVGLALASRGWLQPLTEARVARSHKVEQALALIGTPAPEDTLAPEATLAPEDTLAGRV
jgi:NAD(P)-dependent dehydrogenase (short-subunit alcohol dehydrogenase family)